MESVGSGIHLCGQGISDARVRHSTIRGANGWGILTHDGASYAMVHHNSSGEPRGASSDCLNAGMVWRCFTYAE